jgi:transposase-like protein
VRSGSPATATEAPASPHGGPAQHKQPSLEELLPAAWHRSEQYANNHIEADHGRLKARLRPMRGLKHDSSARVIIAGHAFVQNVRRGHYELAVDEPASRRLAIAFEELALAV